MAVKERQKMLVVMKSKAAKDDPKSLKLVVVSLFGTAVIVLFDSGAVSSVMSAKLCSGLQLLVQETGRRTKMADGSEAWVIGEVSNVLVTVGGVT